MDADDELAKWVLRRHRETGQWPSILAVYEEALRLGLSPNETEAVKQERAARSALSGG